MPSDLPSGERVSGILSSYVERRAAGENLSIEDLCREHPELARELRQAAPLAHSLLGRLSPALGSSLRVRLNELFGREVDPLVTLEQEGPAQSGFSAELMSRLAGRGLLSARYRIQGEVAHGGMGAILRVWDEDLRRHLAMKVMLGMGEQTDHRSSPLAEARSLARFLEEAQVTGQLDHPGIVPVHELGLDGEGRVYFTMKLVKGRTLKEVFDEFARGEGGWTQTRVLGLLLKVCEAMSYAHVKGVIHRDLKPANIMVGRYGEVYVMDWGLAKVLDRAGAKDLRIATDSDLTSTKLRSYRSERSETTPDSPLFTMDGDVVGTPAYMSPEQAQGDVNAMGPPSDVYALGAMLYQLLAGHAPYARPGARAGHRAIWQLVRSGPPEPLMVLAPQAPDELVAICERAMAREGHARYPDMSALAEDLAAYLEGRVVRAYETGAWAEAKKWIRRNSALAFASTAALLLALGGLASTTYVQAKGRKAERVQRRRAEEETAKVLRLSDLKVLQELEAEADGLWPAYPDKIAAMKDWLGRARDLVGHLAIHRETLLDMRGRAHPWTQEEQARDRRAHPKAEQLMHEQAQLADQIAQLEQGLNGEEQAAAERAVAQLEAEIPRLSAAVESRRTWTLDSPEEQWQHDVLAELIEKLEAMEAGLLAEDAISEKHGWAVPKRLAFAERLAAGFAPGGEFEQAWSAALPGIAKSYPGLQLEPQLGLVPIGQDTQSGLWEFAHLMTGVPPARDPDGKLALTEDSSVVLVLLPSGRDDMGSHAGTNAAERNHDSEAKDNEGPVHEVSLSAFFLSKYEMTQGQWMRITGANPSTWGPHHWGSNLLRGGAWATLLHPVESVAWLDCTTWLERAGLSLPSEAQWEFAARAGTSTPWWSGVEKASLAGAANLIDSFAKGHGGGSWQGHELWLDDGAVLHSAVGAYAPNGFGLFDVAGNVTEWCLDDYYDDFYARSPESDPVCWQTGAVERVLRGGSFVSPAAGARSADRGHVPAKYVDRAIGVRPARVVDR